MAVELAISAILKEVLRMLSSPVVAEFWLLWGVKKDQRKLLSSLTTIEAVLQDAEERQVKEKAVRDWLWKLKDAAYDAQDLVDEFMTEALRRRQAEMHKKVGNTFFPSFRYKMARKMKKLRERLDDIAKERDDFHLKIGVIDRPSSPILMISSTRETHSHVIESEVYGRGDEKAKIINSLINSGNEQEDVLSVIAIVGMGGLGKTTLAQLVYNDQSVVTHFELRMWVYVSEIFDVGRLVKEILQSAINRSFDQVSLDLLQKSLRESLNGKKYLLVLDDVWTEDLVQWDQLRTLLKCGAVGSKILVTTRSAKVASITGACLVYPLGLLSDDDSWSLFEHFAFEPDKIQCQPNLESIGKEILSKCGGVPLAIKTLGSLLYSETSESKWLSVKNSEIWESDDKDRGILPALRLSYNHLASPLKQCFTYCAAFPKGHRIEKDKLIKQWMAQGYIQSNEGDDLLEEKGDSYFGQLLCRSFFQDAGKDKDSIVIFCKMHDLVHDLARSVAGTECTFVEDRSKDVLETTRHLSLCHEELKIMEAMKTCKQLRSILSFASGRIIQVDDFNVCLSFRCLRVLDITNISIMSLPTSLDKLTRLRYLDLSYTFIRELPESICNLINLQTLKLHGTDIKKFPNNMKRMTSLRHIEFDRNLPLPNGIRGLTCLRTLSRFIVSKNSGVGSIEELKGLDLLQGEFFIEGLHNIENAECAREANLNEKQYLSSLTLSWEGVDDSSDSRENSEKVIKYLEPHANLKRLHVYSYMGLNFPRWRTLTKLVEILLSDCTNCEHLPPLGQLPFLESLKIFDMDALKYIVDFDSVYDGRDKIFSSLKKVELHCIPNLKGWSSLPADDGLESECQLFPCLQVLKVWDCPVLAHFPRDLPALEVLKMDKVGCVRIDISTARQTLKRVDLINMPDLKELSSQQAPIGSERREKLQFRCLRQLIIDGCPKLNCVPRFFLPALEYLRMQNVNCGRIRMSKTISLKEVHLTNMPNLEGWSSQQEDDDERESEGEEQDIFPCLLHTLHVYSCPQMINLPRLEILTIIGDTSLMSQSNQLNNLSTMKKLTISGCDDLVLNPDGLQCLSSLEKLNVNKSGKKQISFQGDGIVWTNLKTLNIEECENVESFFEGLQNLPALQHLLIKDCPNLKRLPEWVGNLTSLTTLFIEGCGDLVLFPDGFQCLSSLQALIIRNSCNKQASFLQDGFVLANLRRLELGSFDNVESIFEGLQNHPALEILNFHGCPKLKYLPKWVESLASVGSLGIIDWPDTTQLLELVENFEWLNTLWIENCPGMKALPASLRKLSQVKKLKIERCPYLVRLVRGVD